MTIQADAVYLDGVFKPVAPVALPNGAHVRIAVVTPAAPEATLVDSIDPLAAVIGVADGPESGDVAARHDEYLYGERS